MNRTFLKKNATRLLLLAVIAAGAAAFFVFGGHRAVTFEEVVAHRDTLIGQIHSHPLPARTAFIFVYLVLGLFGLPGSTALNIAAGLLFGFAEGLLLVILASTLASSLAFFSFRYLFRGFVEEKVRSRFPRVEEDLAREGAYFVFSMRLFPVIPYSVTNLVLAISPVRFPTYLVVTFVALLPRYLLYVYAGANLGEIRNPEDIFSPALIGVLALLAVLPWAIKWAAPRLKKRFGGRQ